MTDIYTFLQTKVSEKCHPNLTIIFREFYGFPVERESGFKFFDDMYSPTMYSLYNN